MQGSDTRESPETFKRLQIDIGGYDWRGGEMG